MNDPTVTVAPREWVSYHSRGICLVIASADSKWHKWNDLPWPPGVRPFFLLLPERTGTGELGRRRGDCIWTGRLGEIRGYLGEFEVMSDKGENWAHIMGVADGRFDMVLDLTFPPLLEREVPPPGYVSVPVDSPALHRVVAALAEWVGTFDKPRYFSYRKSVCAHGASGTTGCTRCLEVCAAEAIGSEGDAIKVNPYLCQGCGDCTSACPSGALNYTVPRRDRLLDDIRARLLDPRQGSGAGEKRVVLIHEESQGNTAETLGRGMNLVSLPVEALGSVGPEIWLAALAYGAGAVWLLDGGIWRHTRENLQSHMTWVGKILAGLGYGRQRIRWVGDAQRSLEPPANPDFPPARFAAVADKREMLYLALSHLVRHAPEVPEAIGLPEGSPMGGIAVDARSCTLCMACVNVCPAKALQAGGEGFRLMLVEMNCVQCGLCLEICPEDAIRLQPRFLTDREASRRPRELNEGETFHCLDCGRPFASAKIIEAVRARLGGHPMFADDRRRRRLMLCEECRIRDMVRGEG